MNLFVGVFSIETRVTFWFVFGLNSFIGEVCRRVLDECVNIGIFGVSLLVQIELVGSRYNCERVRLLEWLIEGRQSFRTDLSLWLRRGQSFG